MRRQSDRDHADLRVRLEADAELLADAAELLLERGVEAPTLRRCVLRLRESAFRLAEYERANGVDLGRDAFHRTVLDLVLAAEVAQVVQP